MVFGGASLGRVSRRPGPWLDWIVPAGFGLALALLTPWRTAFRFDMDEGFELMKGLLVSRGHPLYGAFWNDQPPLHTEVLAGLFRLFGPSGAVGRALSMSCAVLLVGTVYHLARRGSNRLAGLAAVGLLASASAFLSLSVSVMLELPAFALGLAGVWLWVKGRESGRTGWFALSGAVFGAALQVKFTAAVLLPGMAVDFLAVRWRHPRRSMSPHHAVAEPGNEARPAGGIGWHQVLAWLGGAVGVFGLIMWLWYQPGTWAVFLGSHFSAGTVAGAVEQEVVFEWTMLQEDVGLVAAGLGGLALLAGMRRREALLPAAWLLTVALVHQVHRPFWPYYRLHFAIPLAWLGGLGVVEGGRALWRRFPPRSRREWVGFGLGWLVWSLVVSAALTLAPEKAWWELRRLRRAPLVAEEDRVAVLRELAPRARWIFTEDRLSAFWAGLPIPPELAVIPRKRWWSGQITPEEVRRCLERYRPELVLLEEWQVKRYELAPYLEAHYTPDPRHPEIHRRK
ncbi:MAG: hypothetical protein D6766_04415 [Verrucomicrobia bacterium]|nr:MAG: hypothetical protein D6766_04415 [Verrucomicrobiota bacterium]